MKKTPHLVQYQGSKRNIASEIIKYIPMALERFVEPFSGTCAMSISVAKERVCRQFVINDINTPLVKLMEVCVKSPQELAKEYCNIWNGQFVEGTNSIDYYYKIRDEFNEGIKDPARMLFLLARVVKGAVRYNSIGMMNQSCDKRRFGTKPDMIYSNAMEISGLLKGKTAFYSLDYQEILKMACPGDLIYMDPPYQGTSNIDNTRDNRYIQGVNFEEFVLALEDLNQRGIDYIVSYDGLTGQRKIGRDLPEKLELTHLYINAGRSAQATLNGRKEITYESLYLSKNLYPADNQYSQLELSFA